jgi:Fur family ferric uptake transcriptional regulator
MNTSHLIELLNKKKINPTSMRMLVLDFLTRQKNATSLSQIEENLHPADRVTIYRTLKIFEEKGLVHSISDGSSSPKFFPCDEACDHKHLHDLHVHFTCNVCKKTSCISEASIQLPQLPELYKAETVQLLVKGICPSCKH